MKPDYRVVAIDESAHCSPAFLAQCGGKVWATYVYNAAEVTYCCELTPSYCLLPIELHAHVIPDDETAREALFEALIDAQADSDPIYLHCSAVDRLPENQKLALGARFADSTMDETEEYLRGTAHVPPCIGQTDN